MQNVPRDFELPFVKKEQIVKDIWTFYFSRKDTDVDFLAGQFIRMTLAIKEPDERGSSRTFSISSSPLDKEYLTITTRVLQSTFKQTLFNLAPGVSVSFFGPNGRFLLVEENKQYVFLAGGIGITPMHSMIRFASQANLKSTMMLFASFSSPEEMIFYDELVKISKDHQNITVIYTITKPEISQMSWTGEKGRISADLIKKYAPDFVNALFYVSGPPVMVDAMLSLVKEMGIPDERVKKEKFVGY
jgi:ferredoxin-NADP reductase